MLLQKPSCECCSSGSRKDPGTRSKVLRPTWKRQRGISSEPPGRGIFGSGAGRGTEWPQVRARRICDQKQGNHHPVSSLMIQRFLVHLPIHPGGSSPFSPHFLTRLPHSQIVFLFQHLRSNRLCLLLPDPCPNPTNPRSPKWTPLW